MIKKLITVIALCATFLCFPQTIAAQEQRNVFLDVNNNKVCLLYTSRFTMNLTIFPVRMWQEICWKMRMYWNQILFYIIRI